MTDENEQFFVDNTEALFNQFYPTPRQRIENSVAVALQKGDLVKVLIGPAIGKTGIVVVERNGNYIDYEPYSGPECIAVAVFERRQLDPIMEKIVVDATQDPEALYHRQVRWFDGPDQLELMQKSGDKKL